MRDAKQTIPAPRGFSVIEILIAVLVMGLGLLGLAAVFPTVIAQQRASQDSIVGPLVLQQAVTTIEKAGAASLLSEQQPAAANDNPNILFGARGTPEMDNNAYGDGSDGVFSYLWEVDWEWSGLPSGYLTRYRNEGSVRYLMNQSDLDQKADDEDPDLSVYARLVPAPFTGSQPEYVWDFVPRRTQTGEIEAAVFVRRIDPGIRPQVQGDDALSQTLTGVGLTDPDIQQRMPVGWDSERNRPSRDGTGEYSVPVALEAELLDTFDENRTPNDTSDDPLDDLELRGRVIRVFVNEGTDDLTNYRVAGGEMVKFLARPGQLLVDNLGVVREVQRAFGQFDLNEDDRTAYNGEDEAYLVVSPGYSATQMRRNVSPLYGPADDFDPNIAAHRATRLRQVIFTPQTPVAVEVVELSG